MSPLEKAIQIIAAGNQSEFARVLTSHSKSKRPLSQQLVSYWVNEAGQCSPKYASLIQRLTEGKVSKYELRPDVFFDDEQDVA